MNLFILDNDPITAAGYYANRHCGKIVLETAQMLCTVIHAYGGTAPYKPTHPKHPCVLWLGDSRSNYLWACVHAKFLALEHHKRYGTWHKSLEVVQWCSYNIPFDLPDVGLTPFAQAMPEVYKQPDAVAAYRAYYQIDKRYLAEWFIKSGDTRIELTKPHWWSELPNLNPTSDSSATARL